MALKLGIHLAFLLVAMAMIGCSGGGRVTPTTVPARATGEGDLAGFEARTFVDAEGHRMPYRLLVPEHYDPKVKYPLVLVLHGGGGQGDDNIRQMGGVERLLGRPDMRAKFPCIAVMPQCPAGSWWGYRKRPASTATSAPTSRPEPAFEPLPLVPQILDQVRTQYSIDPGRIYVTGVSMGGSGTWSMIARYPRLFAAAAPMCGTGDPASAKAIAEAHLPMWVWHGEKDDTVPVQRSREMVAALKDAGWTVKYSECAGVGHLVWDVAFADDAVWTWMFGQKRTGQ